MMLLRDNVMIIRNDGWGHQRTHTASRSAPDPMRITSPIKNNKILILY